MKRIVLMLFVATALIAGCSSDKENEGSDPNDIVGTWDLVALEIDETTATDDEEFAKELLEFLTALDCYILTYTFNADGSVVSENKGNYLEVNANPGGSGLDIPCPSEQDTEEDEYVFDGEVLTYIDESGETDVSVDIMDNTIRINAIDLDVENFDDGGTLVFARR
jgi:hypothetical protein